MDYTDKERWLKKLAVFRAELAEVAFSMDRRGRAEAADVAMMAFSRVGQIYDELQSPRNGLPAAEFDEVK